MHNTRISDHQCVCCGVLCLPVGYFEFGVESEGFEVPLDVLDILFQIQIHLRSKTHTGMLGWVGCGRMLLASPMNCFSVIWLSSSTFTYHTHTHTHRDTHEIPSAC